MMKAQTPIEPRELIRTKLNHGHAIRPFPRVVNQLLSAFEDPNADAKTFARIIEADAALAAKLLRMANSPVYGFSNVIRSIEHATVVLGMGPLKNVALTFAGSSLFAAGDSAVEQREALWNHSLGCATAARLIAKHVTDVDPDEAFLAGIFHDIGKLIFFDVLTDEYSQLARHDFGCSLIVKEQECFAINHQEVGAQLIKTWQLPEKLMVVAENHHHPDLAIAHQNLTNTVHVADLMMHAISQTKPQCVTNYIERAQQVLGLDEATVATICLETVELLDAAQKAYGSS